MPSEAIEFVDIMGARLWTASRGCGVPVVLCHGGPGLCDNLGPVAEMIEDLARVHRYDQRGSGRSSSNGPFEVACFLDDLEALREHWGYQRWVVGGHSWGANLALFYALAHPENTVGVIYLAGTGLRWGWQEEARKRRLPRLTEDECAELARLEQAMAGGNRSVIEHFLRLWWSTDFAEREKAKILDERPLYEYPRDETIFRETTQSYKAHLNAGIEDEVAQLDVPLLVVHGAHDTDPTRARRVAELAPKGNWRTLDAAHSPWFEQPAALRTCLREFLDELPQT
jgi:proline iminopeptidase